MKIAVGTESSLKLRAVEAAVVMLSLDAVIEGVTTDSGIPNQPFEFPQIISGALNRAKGALEKTDADIGIGIESGLIHFGYPGAGWYDPPCVAIRKRDGDPSVAFGAFLPIPDWVVRQIKEQGTELGHVVQKLANIEEKDPHRYFTNCFLDRKGVIMQAVLCAFAPILFEERYLQQSTHA